MLKQLQKPSRLSKPVQSYTAFHHLLDQHGVFGDPLHWFQQKAAQWHPSCLWVTSAFLQERNFRGSFVLLTLAAL